jgi:hypothetical protein
VNVAEAVTVDVPPVAASIAEAKVVVSQAPVGYTAIAKLSVASLVNS